MVNNNDGKTTVRYDTAKNWRNANPVLDKGEIGVESDTNCMKVGDGVTNWNNLIYANLYKNSNIAKGAPTDNSNWNLYYFYYDKNNVRLGGLENGYNAGNVNRINIIAYKANTTDNSTNTQIGVGWNGDNWFTYAPTPANSSNDNNIATTQYVRNSSLGNVVDGSRITFATHSNLTQSNWTSDFTKTATVNGWYWVFLSGIITNGQTRGCYISCQGIEARNAEYGAGRDFVAGPIYCKAGATVRYASAQCSSMTVFYVATY